MDFLKNIQLIQGGMGVYVSNWRLAKTVAMARPGVTVGAISGTALDVVYVRLLQLGDPGGHVRRALAAFDAQFDVEIGKKICEHYFIEGGKAPGVRFKNAPAQVVRPQNGGGSMVISAKQDEPTALVMDDKVYELLIVSAFAETWLAKEGHNGKIFVNFMKKIELPLMHAMYGAMLAGVDGIIVGAGNPEGLPAMCSRLARQEAVKNDLLVLYREAGEHFYMPFDPKQFAGGKLAEKPLQRPAFLAIASLENLVEGLAHSPTEAPDGFVIEHHTAGGHNAGPQGPLVKDSLGQPIYGAEDEPDLGAIRAAGLPFWLAGGYGSREKLKQARAAGANGVQVGSVFALAEDSGLKASYRTAIFDKIKRGVKDDELVQTTLFSPTGYPFKVAQVEDTLAEEKVYNVRRRVCDIHLLQQRGLSKPAADGSRRLFQRCEAAPIKDYVSKRGLLMNTKEKRCLCNGLLSGVGLGQTILTDEGWTEEPAIITLGNELEGIRRLSRQGQSIYWARDVVNDILGEESEAGAQG
ncbi:MAG: nitronate monooxygenase [Anaerolineaceae bacterium]|nr:nitronate monooxygenase [Anaerolineaceae bacterium]